MQEDAARYTRATAADLQRVVKDVFARPKVVLTVVPQGQKELMVQGGAK